MMQNEIAQLHFKTIDRFNAEKLYIQLTRIFLEEIRSGKWERGRQIFTEEELCRQYNVSKITVRQAINNLAHEGYLIKIQGKGTFVNSVLPAVGIVMKTHLTEYILGKEVEAVREILSKGPGELFAKDYFKTEGELFYILCRGLVRGEPAYIEESFIPYAVLPDSEGLDFRNCTLCEAFEEKGAKKIFRVVQTIEISRIPASLAVHLNLNGGEPVIVMHRLFFSSDNTEIAYTRYTGRSEKHKFQIELERIR